MDDHGLFRESLSRLLQAEPELQIVNACGSIDEGLTLLRREYIDLVLLDYDLGEEQGIYYRLRTGPFNTHEKAALVCASLKERKVECLVSR